MPNDHCFLCGHLTNELSNGRTCSINQCSNFDLISRLQVCSVQWLKDFGLNKFKLDEPSIIRHIGFKMEKGYISVLQKYVSSKYGQDTFKIITTSPSLKRICVSIRPQKLFTFESRLKFIYDLLNARLHWLLSEDTLYFGVIPEKCVGIILHFQTGVQNLHNFYLRFRQFIASQLSTGKLLKIVRLQGDVEMLSSQPLKVFEGIGDTVIEWLLSLETLSTNSKKGLSDAILVVSNWKECNAVYFITVGAFPESWTKDILQATIPVHTVMYAITEKICLDRYRSCRRKNNRFHAYVDPSVSQQELVPTSPTALGYIVSDDCRLIVEEMERTHNCLALVRDIVSLHSNHPLINGSQEKLATASPSDRDRHSRKLTEAWLARFGVRAQKLAVEDVLPALSFKHCDGIVRLPSAPTCSPVECGAVISPKFVSAVYCQEFVHVCWKDGKLFHTQITPLDYRLYQSRMRLCLARIKRRIRRLEMDPLGSFSVSLQDQAYILIDTSASMETQIGTLRKILFEILDECFHRGLHANFVSFGSTIQPWREEIELITGENHVAACLWIDQLKCRGSTNVFQALDYALADAATRCVYLFSDGRPDQPPELIFSRVRGCRSVRIHTICLNSTDAEANAFLDQLARLTGGQFCSQMAEIPTSSSLPASEALQLLRQELQLGKDNLQKMSDIMQTSLCLAKRRERPDSPPSSQQQKDLKTRGDQPLHSRRKKINQNSSLSSSSRKTTHCERSQLARNNPTLASSDRLGTKEQGETGLPQTSQSLVNPNSANSKTAFESSRRRVTFPF